MPCRHSRWRTTWPCLPACRCQATSKGPFDCAPSALGDIRVSLAPCWPLLFRQGANDMLTLNRRALLLGGGSLAGCTTSPGAVPALVPIRARTDRIFDIAVCLRPFRAAGPRLDTERVGNTLVVHNYGHGGSGWSLSWGSSAVAVRKAMASRPREVAVIGCGVLGLTSAILAQRAGARVTIHA